MDINKRNRTELKSYFVKNAIPTESNFADLIEGALNQKDDGIVKLPGNPLSIEASGDATSLKKSINFYRNFSDANPDWTINLNPRSNPNDAATARLGFNISDSEGNSRLFIDRATGNVGIGTTSPGAKLEVGGDISAGNSDIYFTKTDHIHSGKGNTAGYAALENAKDYDALMILGRAGTAKGRYVRLWDYLQVNGGLDITGNVGIGTATPNVRLHVNGDIRAENGTLWLRAGADVNHGVGWYGGNKLFANTNVDGPVVFGFVGGALGTTQGGQKLALSWDSSGNVNLGTSSSLSFGSQTRQMINLWNTEYGVGIQNGTQYFRTGKNFAWYKGGAHNDGELNAGGGTVQMVINDGNAGIGTTTPKARLEVQGTDYQVAITNAAKRNWGFTNWTDDMLYFQYREDGAFTNNAMWLDKQGNLTTRGNTSVGGTLTVTGASTFTGNVGIGAATPEAKLEINATTATHGGWLEAIRFTRAEHSAITLPGGGLLFGLHSDRNFYFADIKDGLKKYVMAINAETGNVGIGISPKPEKRLHIEAGELRVRASHNNTTPDIGTFYAQNLTQGIGIGYNRIQAIGSNAAQEIRIMAKGAAGVFLQTGGDRYVVMQADGNLVIYDSAGRALWASGTNISDVRVKENIHTIDNALAKVLHLRGVSFSWIDKKMGDDEEIGLVAQEVETVVPYLVHSVDQKTKMIRYEKCVPLLVEAIKEQQARIEQLRAEIQVLKA